MIRDTDRHFHNIAFFPRFKSAAQGFLRRIVKSCAPGLSYICHKYGSYDIFICVKTTIEIPDVLFRQAKRLALDKHMTLRQLFQEALLQFLKNGPLSKKRSSLVLHTVKGDGYVDPALEGNWPAIRAIIYEGRGG